MASGRCDLCGVEEYMPYACKFCKGRFCAAHRLPENHDCQGLGAFKDRVRAEGRVFAPQQESPMTPRVSTTARAGASMDALWSKLNGKMTYVMIGACVAFFFIQVMFQTPGDPLAVGLFGIRGDYLSRPWTILTSIFAHGHVWHLLFNMLALFFFGQSTERLIGSRRFFYLFMGAGILAGIAQVILNAAVFKNDIPAVGASGALMGVMGTLAVLAPSLTVLIFFVVPAPLWALTAFYVVLDLAGILDPTDRTARFAHLAGLATGLAFGFYLRKKGLRAVVRRAPPMWSR